MAAGDVMEWVTAQITQMKMDAVSLPLTKKRKKKRVQ